MIENIVAYGISIMFFQIIQTNNMVQLLKTFKKKKKKQQQQQQQSNQSIEVD